MSSLARNSLLFLSTAVAMLTVSFFASANDSPYLHNPLRIRVNSELIRNVFHKRDQDILKIV